MVWLHTGGWGSWMMGPFPRTTSNSMPIAGSGVRMSLNMMTPSGRKAFPRLHAELYRDLGRLGAHPKRVLLREPAKKEQFTRKCGLTYPCQAQPISTSRLAHTLASSSKAALRCVL